MSVPVAPNNFGTPLSDAGKGANHQVVRGASLGTYTPSYYNPVPVASALKGGVSGTAYSETITAQGGLSPYTFAVTSGSPPTGTSMSSGGVISGTPSAAGTFSFIVTVTDANSATGSQTFSITIATPSSGGGGGGAWVSIA